MITTKDANSFVVVDILFVGVLLLLVWCLSLMFITPSTFTSKSLQKKIAGAIPFTLSSNNSRCFGIVCFGKPKTSLCKILIQLLNEQLTHEIRQFLWVVCCSLEVQMKIFCTEEGYDSGQSPEPFVNVTAVPFVSEILQVHEKKCIFFCNWIKSQISEGIWHCF